MVAAVTVIVEVFETPCNVAVITLEPVAIAEARPTELAALLIVTLAVVADDHVAEVVTSRVELSE